MGLFYWNTCGEPGCGAQLFCPLFAKDQTEPRLVDTWASYLTEQVTWYLPPAHVDARCPAHHPSPPVPDALTAPGGA